ncbi:MAG: ABC transporter permease [Flavobacteriales bacterium]|nr:ABC transporter permease [Flavobacteriales bacterium]
MNFEFFFAKKIIKGGNHSFSKPIVRISILAIALGIAMMTLSLTIVEGFQEQIRDKISGFGAHITIQKFQNRGQYDSNPISLNRGFIDSLSGIDNIRHIQSFAYKGAVLKTDEENQAVLLKGVGSDYNWEFFNSYLKDGRLPRIEDSSRSNEVMISENLAKKLKLSLNDEVLLYFVQQPPRFRKFTITGLYNTGLGEMDDKVMVGDIKHLQKLNNWDDRQVGGLEVMLNDFERMEESMAKINEQIDYDLAATSITESRVDIFNWLELQDVNVVIIIGLLILVCGIDIISALLILILEKTRTIGVLKALGSRDASIRKIFIYHAAYLVISGLIIGNLMGLGIAYLQLEVGFMKLPQEAYFIDRVPIVFSWWKLALLNLGTLAISILMLIFPSSIIAGIEPVRSIRFD